MFFYRVVEFASYSDLKNALEKLSGKEINGRKIKLIEAAKKRWVVCWSLHALQQLNTHLTVAECICFAPYRQCKDADFVYTPVRLLILVYNIIFRFCKNFSALYKIRFVKDLIWGNVTRDSLRDRYAIWVKGGETSKRRESDDHRKLYRCFTRFDWIREMSKKVAIVMFDYYTCSYLAYPIYLFFSFLDREVDPGLRAPLGHALALVVALNHAPPDAPAALQRPTTTPAPAVPLPLEAHHPRPPNRRSLPNAPPRRASPQPHPPLRLLREPPSPVPAHVRAPALVLLLLTASVKSCIYISGASTVGISKLFQQ